MRKFLLPALSCLILFSCHEKKQAFDKDSAEGLLRFIPEHYHLLDTARGDLNRDDLRDLIMILTHENDSLADPENPIERPLLLLLGQKDGTYKEAMRHPKAIYCSDCGGMLGDPYQKTSIHEGDFVLEHFGGSSWKWARTTTFRYVPSREDWFQLEDAFVNYHGGDPDNIETRILSPKDFGEVRFSEFDIYKQ